MLKIRKSHDRGHVKYDWLDTKHTFSFADYYDPQQMGFRDLRVINQDIVQPVQGFATHRHHDMEIITFVLRGAIAHKDSMGNGTVIKPGEIQRMSAGTGVSHSEFNHSQNELLELLQIWILPEKKGLEPSYQQASYTQPENNLQLLVARDDKNAVINIHQDIKLWLGNLAAQRSLDYKLNSNRHIWIQVIKGELQIKDVLLKEGDGAAISEENNLTITAQSASEFLLFDLN